MSSGPLVFIHRTADESSSTEKVISQGIYDDSFYWESSSNSLHRSPAKSPGSHLVVEPHAVTGSSTATVPPASTTAAPATTYATAATPSLLSTSNLQPPPRAAAQKLTTQQQQQQRRLYDHCSPPSAASASASSELICDQSANDLLLAADRTSASTHCGHSDPNLRDTKDLGFPTMSFNNLSISKPAARRGEFWTENEFTVLSAFTEAAPNCQQQRHSATAVSSNSFSMIPFNSNNNNANNSQNTTATSTYPDFCPTQQPLGRPATDLFFSSASSSSSLKQRPRETTPTVTTQPPPLCVGISPKSTLFFPHLSHNSSAVNNNDLVAELFVSENFLDTAAAAPADSQAATILNNRNGFLPNNSLDAVNYPFYVRAAGRGAPLAVDTLIDNRWRSAMAAPDVVSIGGGGFASTPGNQPPAAGRMDSVHSVTAPPPTASSNTTNNGGSGGGGGGCGATTTEGGGTAAGAGTVTSGGGGQPPPATSRRSAGSDRMDLIKQVRPSSDTNVISLTDNPGAPMLKADSTLSLDTDSRARACCFCWCCCCSCSCIQVPPGIDSVKRSNQSVEEQHRTETQILEPKTSYDDLQSWAESFDNLMHCFTTPDGMVGQRAFRDFLRSEYSEENILFWLACEDLKRETCPELIEEKVRIIYENYISILSPKEVSLDSRVRDIINNNMSEPTPHTFDEAQVQIYTLMQRDSYPRFLNSRVYKDLLAMAKCETTKPPC